MLLQTDKTRRILILMSDTGGGHRAAAEAIREALYREPGPQAVAVELVDVFRDYSPAPFKYLPEIYPWWVNNSKQSWGAGYKLSNTRQRARILSTTIFHTLELGLKRLLREHPADVIVCVHSALARPTMKAMQSLPGRASFVVVVTDLVSTHHMWYERRAERTLVPTAAAYARGLENGMTQDQLRLTGLPVHPNFIDGLTDRASARERLGLDPHQPVVLLVGGVDGMGPVYRTALAINERRPQCQLLVITGRNATLRQRLQSVVWNQPTRIYGFRRDMPVVLAATDIIVTKAGPATISEACIAGVPLILYDAIPGQETGNVDWVIEHGVGVFTPEPREIGDTLLAWLAEGPQGLQRRSQRARAQARPNAVFEIAADIWHQAQQGPQATRGKPLLLHGIEDLAAATRRLTRDL
ncbi:MAG: galactosyldiacylglycerol synthase [Anaerolineae bacterium]|nr:galactosyldiacylglycerol synthase [Anaerolineae bacterium]